ncbi:MAG: hypothetical protein K2X64_11555, partial [Rhodocyclaceae bacterium]|nr:hypothetical protein [Rhodocyclaceae bacterium]
STAQHAVLKLCPDIAKRYRSPLVADYLAEGHDLHPGRVWMHALFEAYRAADWRDYEQGILSFIALIKGEKELPPLDQMELAHHSLLFTQPMDAAHRRLLSQHIAKRVATDVELRRLHRRRRSERPTLRIGYLSPNFGPRPSTTLLGQLFSRHDRTRFEVFAYAIDRAAPTPEKENIAAQVDTFRELGHLPTSAIAQIICHDEIDVLIDLAGYNWQARPEILAYRPAPVQINYLDFMGTTGAPWIDYCLLDRTSMQASERAFWTEKVAYLPWVTHPCELPVPVTQEVTRNDVGLPPTGLVISVLHSPLKLEPWSVSVWADVMRQLPHSYVWFQYELPEQVTNLTACMESHGVAPERLLFFPRQARTHYLQCLALADLHLDTLVFNGHTTTIETLGVGVPVVTLMGDRVVSRMAGAMLQAHHLPELVASSVQEYVEIAVRLGSDEHWRQEIRQRIQNTEDSKLFNPELRVREIETAYEMMWARHQAGLPPEDFDVPEWSGNISGARS